ncbi:tripartite tricarboxylate transporter permease [Natrarchaeobius chitinivorans]|uniref:DUF112 domain-containing protein n=1 Tax=Natrarchaeobius chitinivorans TaxID=1679083 RepID=A0A3N6P985_NATCH|nr:tripartite tricarboxylate transporter permease [Natrarchaeobius chitinivorans]RQG95419.1 hypothetical protein EA473_08115 [Natrarchaeobius chitinivorans]
MVLEALGEAVALILSGHTLYFLILGLIIGIFVGSLPGIGASLGMAIVLPLTVPMEGVDAIILLTGIYSGAMYGGSISAILFNVPGTAGAAATTFDGYEMAKKGNAVGALSTSAVSSVFGGSMAFLLLILISPIIIPIVLMFGTPEYFLMAIFGLATITIVARGAMVKGFIAGLFGFLLSTVGIAPLSPETRYTFGTTVLFDGLSFIAGLIAVFAVAEMLRLTTQEGKIKEEGITISGNILQGFNTVVKRPILVAKSGLIGMVVGAIPGAGGSISNFVAYIEALRSSKNPEAFGTGAAEGVIAPEASNNATVGGALVPTLSFGIPGSGSTAVLLGGLILHGIRPGPNLFSAELFITYSILIALLVGNLVILVLGILFITRAGYITKIDVHVIIPIIIVLSMLGAYAIRSNWVDVATVFLISILGLYMKLHNYSIIAFVLGMILGPIAEENLARSLDISGDSLFIFVAEPLRILLVLLILVTVFGPILKPYISRVRTRLEL